MIRGGGVGGGGGGGGRDCTNCTKNFAERPDTLALTLCMQVWNGVLLSNCVIQKELVGQPGHPHTCSMHT